MITSEKQIKGFTLLELLIVIAILSVLAMALILVLNPAESLKKSRDSQRMTDLATIKTAIGLYLTNVTSPDLSTDATDNDRCLDSTTPTVFYSSLVGAATVAGGITADGRVDGNVEGTGWLPIKLSDIASGSPISNFPLDPVNDIDNSESDTDLVTDEALVYRYVCNKTNLTYEIDANLESTELNGKEDTDGGNNANLYETGTNLTILDGGLDF